VAAAAAALLLAWIIGGWFVIVHPVLNRPGKADAILVLGPPGAQDRFRKGIRLAKAGVAPTVIISVADKARWDQRGECRNTIPGITVLCFEPSPATTQGEARQIAELSRIHGWHRIVVVTSTYHISRARLIVERCERPAGGSVAMVAAPGPVSVLEYAYEYAYQTAGFVKAFLSPGC
jgi:uncharacterized SAM-binding protein YcdF (DUF218 family)